MWCDLPNCLFSLSLPLSEKSDLMIGRKWSHCDVVIALPGTITSAAILTDKKGRKFGFVNYEESDSAAAAVAELHGKDMRTDEEKENKVGEGEEEQGPDGPSYLLYVQRAQTKAERQAELKDKFGVDEKAPPAKSQQGVNLYVKNLDENTDDASLRALFEPFGTITSVAAMKDDHEKCKGFGFVCFASPDEATKAVTEMHLKVPKLCVSIGLCTNICRWATSHGKWCYRIFLLLWIINSVSVHIWCGPFSQYLLTAFRVT